jgi:hypothetical protein
VAAEAETEGRITPRLGVMTKPEGKPATFEMLRDLSPEEYRKYRASAGRLLQWMFENQTAITVQEAYQEYEATKANCLTAYKNWRSIEGSLPIKCWWMEVAIR